MGAGDEHLAARVGPVAGPGGVGGSGGIDQQLGQAACWLGPLHRPEHCQGEQKEEVLPARKTLRFPKRKTRRSEYCCCTAAAAAVSVFVVKLFFLRTVLYSFPRDLLYSARSPSPA